MTGRPWGNAPAPGRGSRFSLDIRLGAMLDCQLGGLAAPGHHDVVQDVAAESVPGLWTAWVMGSSRGIWDPH